MGAFGFENNVCYLHSGEKMLLFLLHLLILLPVIFGISSQSIYLSPSQLSNLPSISKKNAIEQVHVASISVSFSPFRRFTRRHFKHLLIAPSPSPASQGPISGPVGSTLPRHHHHSSATKQHIVSPSPSTTPGCGQICEEPLTAAPFGSPCACVLPMRVRLLLGTSLFYFFSEVTELEIEIAAGAYLKQSQVQISGANADTQNQGKTVVDVNLVPLGEKFDNTTAFLTYERFLHKKVLLNRTLFGSYDVLNVTYPGLPGQSSNGDVGSQQDPITAVFYGKKQKINSRMIFVIALSVSVFLVICCAATAVLLKCRESGRQSNVVGPTLASSINKRSGLGSMLSSSPPFSTSTSLVSAMQMSVRSVRTFTLAEIEKATEKFNSKRVLGEGGFGRVYHGILEDGDQVAVKLLTRDNQNGDREFISEVEMLSRLHHRNLVKLIGICIEGRTRCLVYELIPNGSVESHLHVADKSKGTLDWDARVKIALGAARGLAYLHEDSNPRVIHRDFKASNVLLENDFTAKVSDFGLAREATEGSHHISTRVMGTFGYVAPEYAMTGHLLVKSDVYSYGVVLLELLSGRKPVDMSQPQGQENLVSWARPMLTCREGLQQLVDPALNGSYDFDDMAKVAAIASMCVHTEVTHRPFMGEVVQALKLIYNDTDETCCGDACSQKESSARDSDFKNDFVPSDSSWWNAGGNTPSLPGGQVPSFITMEYSSGPEEFENRAFSPSALVEGGGAMPTRDGNRSGPLRTVRSNRTFYRLQGSMSEHGGLWKRAWNNGT